MREPRSDPSAAAPALDILQLAPELLRERQRGHNEEGPAPVPEWKCFQFECCIVRAPGGNRLILWKRDAAARVSADVREREVERTRAGSWKLVTGNCLKPMNSSIAIRDETDDDASTISEVTAAAFATLEISGHTEQFVIEALRAANALALSLVAEVDGRVVGHVAFSPVTISDGTTDWYGLGPVSVLPEYQRQGIGKALIQEGLRRLRDLDAKGCCLVGHPQYYRKFGFENVAGLVYQGVPAEVFFALSFDGRFPRGFVTFHEGFRATGPQADAGDASAPR